MTDSPSVKASGAWMPIRRALTGEPPEPTIRVIDPQEADAVASALREACARSPWLLSLVAADPHRFLRAAGITLAGAARERFDQRRQKEGWGDRGAEFERVAVSPVRLASSRLTQSTLSSNQPVGAIPASGSQPANWTLSTAIGRIGALTASSLVTLSSSGSSGASAPMIATHEAGYSHAGSVNFQGTTGSWDVVAQFHESFLKRQYDVLFASQALAGIFGGQGDSGVIDFRFTFEGWLFLFIRCDLVIDVIEEPGRVTLEGAGIDEVGVRFRFTATSYARGTPSADWEQTDQFSGTFTRYGALVKQTPITLAGSSFRRTWAADLANGWTAINLDDGPDAGREMLLDGAVNAYISAELPLLPATPTFTVNKPLISYPTSAGFTTSTPPDLRAVSLCFHENADTLIDTNPMRNYILDHGRNLAIGISIAALAREALSGVQLPYSDGIATVDTITITGDYGRLHIRTEGHGPLSIPFSHTADILITLENGKLVAEVDKSTLNLPWWLWLLNGLLSIFVGVGGLVLMGIANVIGSSTIGNIIEGLIDLSALQEAANFNSGSSGIETTIERVEVNPNGVFLKGNVEINAAALA